MMGADLNELASYMQPLAQSLITQAKVAGLDPVVIDTGRTIVEQTAKIIQGVSWTKHSKHEPQPPEMKSEAIDIAPRSYIGMKLWNPGGAMWARLGAIGKGLGLFWGGDWAEHPDPSHFEYIHYDGEQIT